MKYFILYIISCCAIIGVNLFVTISVIEKHSVHPEFGNYIKNIKIDNEIQLCEPWDYCSPDALK